MESVVVEIRLPAVQRSYEVRIPSDLNTQVAAVLAARAIAPLTDGMFMASKSCRLARSEDGSLVNPLQTLREEKIVNGSSLLLI